MKLFGKTPGRLALAAATASLAVAGLGAGSAQAALPGHCLGQNPVHGQGSSLQNAAQSIWTTQFNINAAGCTAAGAPTVTYTKSGSQDAVNTWRADGSSTFLTSNHFLGTDEPPSAAQITNINTAAGSGSAVLNIPVAQAAIAVVVNPPTGCSISGITATQLEQVFNGDISTWAGISGTSGCGTNHITRVVRADGSGTTYQFKHFLSRVNGAVLAGTASKTWTDLQKAVPNTTWPTSASKSPVQASLANGTGPAAGSGGGDLVKTVLNTTGGIGYAALPDARASYTGTNNYKWIKVSNVGATLTVEPSTGTGQPGTAKQKSNCTTATSGAYGTLPAATSTWEDVYITTPALTYPICTLTLDLAFSQYTPKWGATTGPLVAQTVKDYLGYVVATAGGQADALSTSNDYQVLPSDVRTAASNAVALITN
jgi:ABC-type phosphate transport system substrate-binding protein